MATLVGHHTTTTADKPILTFEATTLAINQEHSTGMALLALVRKGLSRIGNLEAVAEEDGEEQPMDEAPFEEASRIDTSKGRWSSLDRSLVRHREASTESQASIQLQVEELQVIHLEQIAGIQRNKPKRASIGRTSRGEPRPMALRHRETL